MVKREAIWRERLRCAVSRNGGVPVGLVSLVATGSNTQVAFFRPNRWLLGGGGFLDAVAILKQETPRQTTTVQYVPQRSMRTNQPTTKSTLRMHKDAIG